MIDHVRTLLLNPDGVDGYRKVSDGPADAALALFGLAGDAESDACVVDRLLPLALSPDLAPLRRSFDARVTPSAPSSVYGEQSESPLHSGLYSRVFGRDGWWVAAAVFEHADPLYASVLREMRTAAMSKDAPYALGAVLLACAYRRLVLQGGGA